MALAGSGLTISLGLSGCNGGDDEKPTAMRFAVLSDPQLAVGRVARRALGAGTVLGAGDLVAPRIIRRGDSVALVSRRGGVEVRVAGKALGDAGQDERVSVENLSSRRVVQGTVIAGGDVLVSR